MSENKEQVQGVAASAGGHSAGLRPEPVPVSAVPAAAVNAGDGWNPRPDPEGTDFNTRAYTCGYTDGFFGEAFGAHDGGQYGAFSAYRPGFSHGRTDAALAKVQP